METTRQKKVARQIQKDLAEIILKNNNLIYPKSLISVSKVRISPDLSYAKVYLSVFPLKDQKKFLKSINRFSFQIKNELALRVKNQLRVIPELSYFIDDSIDYLENIDKLLNTKTDNN